MRDPGVHEGSVDNAGGSKGSKSRNGALTKEIKEETASKSTKCLQEKQYRESSTRGNKSNKVRDDKPYKVKKTISERVIHS